MMICSIRRLSAVAVLAGFSMAGMLACTSAPRPPPVQPTESATPATPTLDPTTSQAAPPAPAPTRATAVPAAPRQCVGAVVYRFDPGMDGPWPTPCIEVGGVLRVQPHGPDGFSYEPAANVDCAYEAAVHQCRLIATGTVKFTITRLGTTRVLTVNVVKATSPPRPSPACQDTGTFVLDASDDGPPWMAICLKKGVTLRVTNHGPEGFAATPDGIMSCNYAAGVRVCQFLKAGTVELKITRPNEVRTITIVVKN
jgi:hypothetical protein